MSINSKRTRRALHGILLLNKPKGMGSTPALARAKWLLNAQKAGHTGTLDPLAEGLLPLCFGHATKLAHDLLDADKTYIASISLGARTSTGDLEGDVVERNPQLVSMEGWNQAVSGFLGDSQQIPPMYSALKKDGKPLYELARQGVEVNRVARGIYISHLQTLHFGYPYVELEVTCSKGTYVRTLAEDIALAAGSCAHLRGLKRTRVGALSLEHAVSLDDLERMDDSERQACLLPMDTLLQNCPKLQLDEIQSQRFIQGQRLKINDVENLADSLASDMDMVRVYYGEG